MHLQHHVSDLRIHQPKWHKACYSSFTSKLNIQRVVERSHRQKPPQRPGTSQPLPEASPITHGLVPNVAWKQCVYCQTRTKKESLQQVLIENASSIIHGHAENNYALKCRIGVNDLIAYEAHYHSSCRRTGDREPSPGAPDTDDPRKSSCMSHISMLEAGLSAGNV